MLPMILGFLGSAFAPAIAGATGIAALASPLLAGAVGSGLGAAIQTGDIKEGLKAGLGSYAGGALLGGLMGGAKGAIGGAAPGINLPANAVPGASGVAGLPMKADLANIGSAAAPMSAPAAPGLMQSLQGGLGYMKSPTGIGALLGSALAAPEATLGLPGEAPKEELSQYAKDAKKEMRPIPREMRTPSAGYMPGMDAEFDYGLSTPYSYGNILAYRDRGVLPYAEGGKTEIEVDSETGAMEAETERPVAGNEKTEIVDAVMAIKGQHPQPEIALGKFLAKYGEDALRDLVDSVQSGEFDETLSRFQRGEQGPVRGPGDGTGVDDKVPATIEGEQDVLLSDGEFVLRKDATDALEKKYGGGFLSAVNDAGDKAPDVLKKKVAA